VTQSSSPPTSPAIGLEGQISSEGGIRTADAAIAGEQLDLDPGAENPLAGLKVLDPEAGAILTGVARVMYPHDRLPDVHYQRVVAALDAKAEADARVATILTEGIGFLATTTGRRPAEFADLPESDQVRALTRLEHTPFFQAIAAEVVVNLYSQPDVWPYFGYEGPSNDQGGYLHRGFDDIDWLDNAPDRRGQATPTDDGTTRETGLAAEVSA
jgi:hypothetical protein